MFKKSKKFQLFAKKDDPKDLNKIAKKILGKKYESFMKIKDKKEKAEALKYTLISYLKLKKMEIEHKAMKSKDFSLAKERLLIIDPKIRYFEASMKKQDYDSIIKLLGDIEKDV